MSIHKNDYGGYDIRYRDDLGRNRSKSFKKGDREQAKEFDRQMASRRYRHEGVNPDNQEMPVGIFFDTIYLPTRGVSGNTMRKIEREWGCVDPTNDKVWHLRRKWAKVALHIANRPESVDAWHAEMRKAGASRAQVRNAHLRLAAIINVAEEYEYINRSKIKGRVPAYKPKRAGDPWTPDRIEALREDCLHRRRYPPPNMRGKGQAVYAWRRHRDATMISTYGYVALRVGEGLALKWPHVLDEDRTGIATHFRITDKLPGVDEDPEDETKTRKDRTVEVEQAVRDDLLWWWKANGCPVDGYVFAAHPDGTPFKQTTLATWRAKTWASILKRCGEEYREPKHLRRSCVSMWIRSGVDRGTAARWAGHTVEVLEEHYLHEITTLSGRAAFDVTVAIDAARAKRGTADSRPLRAVGE